MNRKPIILVARRLPSAVEDRLRQDYDARLNEDDVPYTAQGLARAAEGADGIIVTPTDRLNAEAFAALPNSVRIVATFSVGYEHIDIAAAGARGIVVTNTPGVLTEATADIALLLMLGAARRASEGDRMIRAGEWTGWTPTQLLGTHLHEKRLGIIGMGRIGQAFANRAKALSMDVHYHNRSRLDPETANGAVYHQDVDSLLSVSDVLSLHCPASPETHRFLNAERLGRLPAGAIVVNTARGSIVDDNALIEALKSRQIGAAGLDVYEGEPDINPGYIDLPNTFLLPHIGSATVETRNAMGFKALENLDAYFARQAPPNRVK